ncbi:MAG: general secretion pathway protein GspB [Rhizobacter sp.]
MSYILDALRRADSERERGAVPSLHAKQVPAALADDEEDGDRGRSQPLLWAVIGLSVVLAAVLAWLFLGRDSPPETVVMAVPAAVQPAVTVASPPLSLQPVPQVLPQSMPTPVEVTAAPAAALPPVQHAPQRKAARPASKAPAPTASAAVVEPRVYALNELPEEIRRELPSLAVGGAMYSDQASSRMLILNGQVFHEGDKVSANLVLEQIKLKSAVLAYKSYRYGINY